MAFAQLTGRESLRDIEACLRAQQAKLYHMGIRGRVSRSTLADANAHRDWRMYADFAHILIHRARALYQEEDFGVDLDDTVYALDSTTIDLCLSVFPWAQFRQTKSAVKLHTLLDLRGPIPTRDWITPARIHDVNLLDTLLPEPGALYLMDRAYLDFRRWQVELFFKWMKQHLRIQSFFGTSINAVKTQLWIAISVYVLVAIIVKEQELDLSLYTFLQILSVTLFEKVDILQLVTAFDYTFAEDLLANQLKLFEI